MKYRLMDEGWGYTHSKKRPYQILDIENKVICKMEAEPKHAAWIIDQLNIAARGGRNGGLSKSPAKQNASRTNGAKGGRPRKTCELCGASGKHLCVAD